MKTPDIIYLQVCGTCTNYKDDPVECKSCCDEHPVTEDNVTWCRDRIYDSDIAYFSEDAVRNLLREEFKQANFLLNACARKNPAYKDLIKIDESVETAIKKLKGEKR